MYTKEVVSAFVATNIIPVKKGQVCIDGRYPSETEVSGKRSMAGGGFCLTLGLLEINNQDWGRPFSAREIAHRSIDAAVELDGEYSLHTDTHSLDERNQTTDPEDKETNIGCAHIKKSLLQPTAGRYGITYQDSRQALLMARSRLTRLDVLGDKHREGAFVIVDEEDFTINHQNRDEYNAVWDENRQQMVFVLDLKRLNKFVEQVTPVLDIPQLNPARLKTVMKNQALVTASLIAPNLPAFRVFRNDSRSIDIEQIELFG